MDVELTDIVEALEEQKEVQQQNEEEPLLDTESNVSSSIIIEDPHIEDHKKLLFTMMQSFVKDVNNLEKMSSYDKHVLSNIASFKSLYKECISIFNHTNIVSDTSNICECSSIFTFGVKIFVKKNDEISVELSDVDSFFRPTEHIFL